ncbi:Ankyrin-3 [Colletotrichum sp. SAR 10_86]|nr:Ankyrin-3 [Colletotrichum sp. SAR 10_65]KAI8236533.1 Ankyrin-3 [Colletotrichum sp. SAR 10_86]KAI8264829.1 Ankyrin-3 [Colletotrichum sp. SAR 10_77]
MREKLHRNSAEHSKTVPDIMPDQELDIAEATAEAEGLSRRVKDILDELSMLEVTVQYQQDVQKAMRTKKVQRGNAKHGVLETDLTATYIINDIKRLNSVAERAHLAVNTTLSLHQSEVANLQAELTMREGKVLMVFTVVTILFVSQ